MLGLGVVVIAVWPGLAHTRVKGALSMQLGPAAAGAARTTAPIGRIPRTAQCARAMHLTLSGVDSRARQVTAYNPFPVTSGRSRVVRIPGSAATTAGMALTIRVAVASTPAWLWSPLGLDRQRSSA